MSGSYQYAFIYSANSLYNVNVRGSILIYASKNDAAWCVLRFMSKFFIADRGLRITKVEKKHAGLFQCFAANPVGTVTSPAELKVMPKMITAMANDSSGKG